MRGMIQRTVPFDIFEQYWKGLSNEVPVHNTEFNGEPGGYCSPGEKLNQLLAVLTKLNNIQKR